MPRQFQYPSRRVYRAVFSSLAPRDLIAACKNLRAPDLAQSLSVDARQQLDLRFGDLNTRLLSFGPCQTPTLAFCVDRHDEIERFKPEPFWTLTLTLQGSDQTFQWKRGRSFDQAVADLSLNRCLRHQIATVFKVIRKQTKQVRPLPLNTVALLKAASSGLGIGSHHTMQIAERLYLEGYISYPRTETTTYAAALDIVGLLGEQGDNPVWGEYVRNVLLVSPHALNGRRGVDVGDHPPITPMRRAWQQRDLSGDEWRVYDYITRHFIGSLALDALVEHSSVEIILCQDGEAFTRQSVRVLEKGFLSVMPWLSPGNSCVLDVQEGTHLGVENVSVRSHQTSPPSPLAESELISLMEKYGIGTDASMATHIKNIQERNYVQLQAPGRSFVPSQLGVVLVHGYKRIDPDLALPKLRSTIEAYVDLMAKRLLDFETVVRHSIRMFTAKFDYFTSKIHKMEQLFSAHFSTVEETHGRRLSKCGVCDRWMKYIAVAPARLHCGTCDVTFALPPNGRIKLYLEKRCPFDNFEVVYFTTVGAEDISYPLCPNCFNDPPFESHSTQMACNSCMHPTCRQSLEQLGTAACDQDDTCF